MTDQPETLYCANHPKTETSLRCNRCNKPICSKCAVLTPIGYRCRECVRGQQKSFETAEWIDYPLGFIVAGILSFAGSLIAASLSFFIIFLAPIAGTIIAEAARFVTRRRRAKRLYIIIAAGALVGSLPPLLSNLIVIFLFLPSAGIGGLGFLLPLLWQGAYAFIVTSTVYYRLGGMVFRR